MDIKTASAICKALSDQNRLKIIELLSDGEKCACRLLEELNITQPTLSHHMKLLTDLELVNYRKSGKWQHYSINTAVFDKFNDFICKLYKEI
ncbi:MULTISPECIES: ArsR/SmtB family transcription factor [Succinivibrio]|uniref:Winged helix-turn-helix transcriptional regulator n=1 Tax=Succinivibrio faecicola TaxID=2820300 RepID=A0ABS7DH27_9GAMM|nr:metalloregulator ArsR/SmtB family transcription factor [Succinivibrio faecicola]MBW7570600.1 winged helix-turn-helix transcriptional regulator [Succinivibrio faecicola]